MVEHIRMFWFLVACAVFSHGGGILSGDDLPDYDLSRDDGLVKHLSARLMEADRNLDQALLSRKKARVEKERILIEVASLLEDLDATMKKAREEQRPRDPVWKSRYDREIVTGAKLVRERYRRGGLKLVSEQISMEELTSIQGELEELKTRGEFAACRKIYGNLRSRLGRFYFEYAASLDPDLDRIVSAIEATQVAEKTVSSSESEPLKADGDAPMKPRLVVPRSDEDGPACAYHVRVEPRRGSAYEAVVRNRKIMDRLEAGKDLDLKSMDASRKITLYYMHGMSGSMGVAVRDIKRFTALAALTKPALEEVKRSIGGRTRIIDDKERERLDVLAKKRAARKAEEAAEADRLAKAREEKRVRDEETKRFALIRRFPPEKGWGPDKLKAIKHRRVVVGVAPTEEEQYFIDHFAEWVALRKAYDAAKKSTKK